MPHKVFVDWGTTNFRAYLVDEHHASVDVRAGPQGVRLAAGRFVETLREHVTGWAEIHDLTAICCAGMIGSDLGWRDVPMVRCPATAVTVAAGVVRVPVPGLPDVLFIPGICQIAADGQAGMMRGEEVLLFGSLAFQGGDHGRFCFPGTHSKWVSVLDGAVRGIDTVMTGECFALLRERSVLSRSLEGWTGDILTPDFLRGVAVGRKVANPLQSAFSVRALDVLGGLPGAAARGSYLSGLLIGAEVAGMAATWGADISPLTLVCEPGLGGLYRETCRAFDIEAAVLDESDCFVAGMARILGEMS